MGENMAKQVKSKKRVADHGEVFTAEREVKAMCDLVADECLRIDSRFLEPAVGEGVFLAEVLTRKLSVVKEKYKKSAYDYERNAILALTSIYGVDILADNAQVCRDKLFALWDREYTAVCKKEASQDTDEPIIFAEWTFPFNDARIKRRDFRLDVLLKENNEDQYYAEQVRLFSDDAMGLENWMIDPVTHERVPKPIREYTLIHYRRLTENG